MNYFLLIDGCYFSERLRPALAASWRARSFGPCQELCRALLPQVAQYHARFHVGAGNSLVEQVAGGLRFNRDFWRALVGELLLYSAEDIPEIQTSLDTLCCLVEEIQQPLVRQSHLGSRPLAFGAAVYRPDRCGLNERDDVQRLSRFLGSLDPGQWHTNQLASLSDLAEEDREDELEFTRSWFPALAEAYRRAEAAGQVIVREFL